MNRIVSTILILVLLDLTIQHLDAWKIESALNNGQKQTVKRRSKRDVSPYLASPLLQGPCNYGEITGCDQYAARNTQVGIQLQNTVNYVQQRKFFLSGLVSMPALQSGGMCVPNSNYFTQDAFSALDCGHLTIPQLSALNLFPIQSIDSDGLLNAAYITRFGQSSVLTGLGVMASLFGHVLPSQLRSLSLYPFPNEMITSSFLQQAGYLHSNCLPTALGLTAAYIHYLPSNFPSTACQLNGDFQLSLDHLISAKYVYGTSKVVTPIGLLAMQHGHVSRDTFRNFGCYPFATSAVSQTQTTEFMYQETQQSTIVSDMIRAGFFHSNMLISNVGYYSYVRSYYTIEQFRSLNLWPCPSTISLSSFIAAGYGSYSGHLTTLGTYLYHAQYFSFDLLTRLGIHLHDDFHMYHQALNYGGYVSSTYHETHSAVHSALTYPSFGAPAVQVGQYQSGYQYQSGAAAYPAVGAYPAAAGTFPLAGAAIGSSGLSPDSTYAKK
ncbi:hypothetical protein I4U23_019605 [Adineta vaga]|nr:hypothetical protein I4U23_019605 [Adineta vaga]